MIRKLRRRFIAIAMASIVTVLAAVLVGINVVNYIDVQTETGEILALLQENNGSFPSSDDLPGTVSPETSESSRYFTVFYYRMTGRYIVDVSHITAVSSEQAETFAAELIEKQKRDGFVGSYRFTTTEYADGVLYIFLDCSSELSSFRVFLWASVIIGAIGCVVIFFLIWLLSRLAFRPVAESYEKQRQFITDAGHEIKTPLTIIDANCEILEMTEGENEWTRSIRNQVKRLTEMTENLVYLSRMEENPERMQKVDFSLTDAVMETAEPFVPLAETRGKVLVIEAERGVSYCGDESSVRKAVSILLDNAVKYASEGGTIRIALKTAGQSRIISVENPAEGIAPGRHDEFFDRFYRADSSRNSSTGGHGIGLSIAKAVAEAHGGKIACRSEDGKTVVFTLVL